MPEATMTPEESGNLSAEPSTDINDPANLNFADESDDQTTDQASGTEVEGEPDESAEDGAQESEESESDETEDSATEEEGEEPAVSEVNLPDEALVTLSNGEKVSLQELKKGYFREADYTRSKQDLGNRFKAAQEQATKLENVSTAIVDFLVQQMPEEPTTELALRDPQQYIQQKAIYDAALARIQGVMQIGLQAQNTKTELTAAQRQTLEAEGREKLIAAMPQLKDPAVARQFSEAGWNAAIQIGYTPEECGANTDHRLNIMAYYAAKGLKAEQAERKVQAKVQAAPKATPAKAAQPKGNPQFLRNKEGMRRLAKTGSINDAMSIDFD